MKRVFGLTSNGWRGRRLTQGGRPHAELNDVSHLYYPPVYLLAQPASLGFASNRQLSPIYLQPKDHADCSIPAL